jgi:hypothetical protein
LSIWFDPEAQWLAAPTGRRGRQPVFTDAALQTCLTLKALFGLPLRQTIGMVTSLREPAGLNWPVPDFSTPCRRQKTLTVHIPCRPSTGALHLLIDSTGVKAKGDGEWLAKKHGPSKPRDWRKVHLGIDTETLEIRAIEVTGSRIGDAPILPDLLDQSPGDQPLGIVTADGAYGTRACHAAIAARGAAAVIPPRKNGKAEYVNPEFREALLRVAGEGGAINGTRLGKWLSQHQNRIVAGRRIIAAGTTGNRARWQLDIVTAEAAAAPDGSDPFRRAANA